MRARAALVRGLALVDDLERAYLNGRFDEARRLASSAMGAADEAQAAFDESWNMAGPQPIPTAPLEGIEQYQAESR